MFGGVFENAYHSKPFWQVNRIALLFSVVTIKLLSYIIYDDINGLWCIKVF